MRRASHAWLALPMAVLLVAMGTVATAAASSCGADCARRMTECRAARCGGLSRKACRDTCRAVTGCPAGGPRVRTLATVVNECRASGGFWTARQWLEIRRGDCAPITVTTVESSEPAPDLTLCQVYGDARDGAAGMAIGVFQGVGVSRDGQTIAFEVTDDFRGLPGPGTAPFEEGLFVVHADGTGLRRIGPQTRMRPFRIVPRPEFPPPSIGVVVSPNFSFSPDGRSFLLTDAGAGVDGSDAPQIFSVDVATGTRKQVTAFPASALPLDPDGVDVGGTFIDGETIGGYYPDAVGWRLFTIKPDGTDFRPIERPAVAEGSQVIPSFRLTGFARDVFALSSTRMTDLPQPGPVSEIFVRDGENVLQLTKLERSDTAYALRLRDREHVLFAASGDPLGSNPSNVCQIFTVRQLGGNLRQLTRFDPHATSLVGCNGGEPGSACSATASTLSQDPVTGAIVFDSSCDPFALSPVSQQFFAIRPDGTGLRQLTDYRGMTRDADGTVTVELPGPAVYSAPRL